MATKPTDLPEWATDETNNTEPSAGQKASGWTNAQVPPSAYFNWYMFTVWLWIDWLNSAVVDFGANTVAAGVLDTDEGDVRHVAVEEGVGIHACASTAGTRTATKIAHGAGFSVFMPVRGRVGSKITSARIRLNDLGGAGWLADLVKMQVSTRTETVVQACTGAGGDAWWTATPATPETFATDYVYYIKAVSGAAGGEAYGGSFTVKRDS